MLRKLKSIPLSLICLLLFVLPLFTYAQENFFGEATTATEMIRNIYWFGVGIVGFAAVVVLVIAGIMYMQSYGDPQKITMAKQFIGGALIGVVLLLFSYTILRTVNPALVSLREPLMEAGVLSSGFFWMEKCDKICGSGFTPSVPEICNSAVGFCYWGGTVKGCTKCLEPGVDAQGHPEWCCSGLVEGGKCKDGRNICCRNCNCTSKAICTAICTQCKWEEEKCVFRKGLLEECTTIDDCMSSGIMECKEFGEKKLCVIKGCKEKGRNCFVPCPLECCSGKCEGGKCTAPPGT